MFTLLPGPPSRAEIVEKRSRFIATIVRTDSQEQAREFISQVRSEFPDARHHCSAFIIASEAGPARTHSSDDGEPSGTAGPPILEVLAGAELENATAVVTRYFGGVLLGTGGLVRAYSSATRAALQHAPLARRTTLDLVQAEIPSDLAGRFQAQVHARGWTVTEESWGKSLRVTLAVEEDQIKPISDLIAALTRRPSGLHRVGTTTFDVPV